MSGTEPTPADYVNYQATPNDVDRHWTRIAEQLQRPPTPWRWRTLGAGLAVAGATALVMLLVRADPGLPAAPIHAAAPSAAPSDTVRVENREQTTRELDLADRSRLSLAPGGAIVLLRNRGEDIHVLVERGDVSFDVTHAPDRRFVVSAAEVDVVVIGTRFVVSLGDGRAAAVSVQRGAVEVRQRSSGARALVRAGESWAAPPVPAAPSVAPPPEPAAPAHPLAPAATAPADDARRLFGVATQARLQGRQHDAAAALDKLYRRFPDDARAPLAAFELGRIQLDSLHDATDAAVAFRAAMNLARDPVLREDAAARHVEALDRSGAAAACRSARGEYLRSHPTGPHVARVTAYCPGP